MSLNANISGQLRPEKDKYTKCLTESQAKYVYKKVEKGHFINVETIRQEMEQEKDKIDDTKGEINLCCEIIVNKAERDDTILSQMEQASIVSNVVNYIQYDRHSENFMT